MTFKSFWGIAAGLVLAITAFQPTQAQTAPPRLVTRDELRACMNSESDIAARRQAIEARGRQNRDEAAAIRSVNEELKAEQEKLEEDQKPMDRFNRKVKAHNARVQAAQAAAVAFNNDLDGLNKSVVGYNQQCGAISFLPEDKEAILKERAAPKN
jgi:septal ring factor EnvC (AmiA/AmiB activator)